MSPSEDGAKCRGRCRGSGGGGEASWSSTAENELNHLNLCLGEGSSLRMTPFALSTVLLGVE